jgi:hypothetical protein
MGSGIADSNQAAAGSQGGNLCQCSPDKQTGGSQGDLGR